MWDILTIRMADALVKTNPPMAKRFIRSLDFLLGYWRPSDEPLSLDGTVLDWGHRIGGAGLYDAAELFEDTTAT